MSDFLLGVLVGGGVTLAGVLVGLWTTSRRYR